MSINSEFQNIGIRHMQAAAIIAAEGSFTAAAARLNVAPSALTETIKQIEAYTGVPIFDRRSRPVLPTQAGRAFIAECEYILALHQASLSRLKRIGGLELGRVTVATAPSLLVNLLAPALTAFSAAHPDIEISIVDEIAGRIEALVLSEAADFGLAAVWKDSSELRAEPIGEDRLGLVCHRSHKLAGKASVGTAEIDPRQIISLLPDTGINQMLAATRDIPPPLLSGRLKAHSTISQLLLIGQNLGVALMPELAATVFGNTNIVYVPLSDVTLTRRLYVLTHPRKSLAPAAARLIEVIRETAKPARR